MVPSCDQNSYNFRDYQIHEYYSLSVRGRPRTMVFNRFQYDSIRFCRFISVPDEKARKTKFWGYFKVLLEGIWGIFECIWGRFLEGNLTVF